MKLLVLTFLTCLLFVTTGHHWAWLAVIAVGIYALIQLAPKRDEPTGIAAAKLAHPSHRDLR